MKALVVDDDLGSRLILQEMLAPYAEVHSCADGSEALWASTRALERDVPYDLICMDLMMPEMGGLEALKLIRHEEARHGRYRPQATKVIIATAADDVDTIDKAFREMCDAYIVKPIDGTELLNLVHCLFPTEERVG